MDGRPEPALGAGLRRLLKQLVSLQAVREPDVGVRRATQHGPEGWLQLYRWPRAALAVLAAPPFFILAIGRVHASWAEAQANRGAALPSTDPRQRQASGCQILRR